MEVWSEWETDTSKVKVYLHIAYSHRKIRDKLCSVTLNLLAISTVLFSRGQFVWQAQPFSPIPTALLRPSLFSSAPTSPRKATPKALAMKSCSIASLRRDDDLSFPAFPSIRPRQSPMLISPIWRNASVRTNTWGTQAQQQASLLTLEPP